MSESSAGPPDVDAIDRALLDALAEDGRATWATLAGLVGLTPPSVAERVRRLEAAGVIRGYHARLDPARLGVSVLAFTAVSVSTPWDHARFIAWAAGSDPVEECHTVAGEFDYLLKIRCRDPEDLEAFLRTQVRSIEGVVRTSTSIALLTAKEVGPGVGA